MSACMYEDGDGGWSQGGTTRSYKHEGQDGGTTRSFKLVGGYDDGEGGTTRSYKHEGQDGGTTRSFKLVGGDDDGEGGTTRSYKHVPHRDKPPQVVERRNARERRRVEAVNVAFIRLRRAVPLENNRGKRVSKVKTLQKAIEYISQLQRLLRHAVATSDKENAGEAVRWPSDPLDDLLDHLEDF